MNNPVNRRKFITSLSALTASLSLGSFARADDSMGKSTAEVLSTPGMYDLPKLSYGFDALEPSIDRKTMMIHYTKHHRGYVTKLNAALEEVEFEAPKNPVELVRTIKNLPTSIQTAVRHNGGGHVNHSLFWSIMSPKGGGEPSGTLREHIDRDFGSLKAFKDEFATKTGGVFGSGWGWLCHGDDGLFITTTHNQDSPYMRDIVAEPGTPLLGLDVWEHAYYLEYQNERSRYINNWWNVVNWDAVAKNYEKAM